MSAEMQIIPRRMPVKRHMLSCIVPIDIIPIVFVHPMEMKNAFFYDTEYWGGGRDN